MTNLVNKYSVAGFLGIAVAIVYIFLLFQRADNAFDDLFAMASATGLLFLAVAGTTLCLSAFVKTWISPAADLGVLHDERLTLMGGMFFALVFSAASALKQFATSAGPRQENLAEWIYNAWGEQGDCGSPLTISRGASDEEVIFEAAGPRRVRRIVGRPTRDFVETDQGRFTRHPDGWMTTTMEGMEQSRFSPCGR